MINSEKRVRGSTPGPFADRIKIDMNWKDAVKKAIEKKDPPTAGRICQIPGRAANRAGYFTGRHIAASRISSIVPGGA